MNSKSSAEKLRLDANATKGVPLEKWGPYLSERQWATVREDYSENGDAWNYFTHDQARSRAYLWGEDGLGGLSDYEQNICFAVALWNGKDPILKERLFGLTNSEGNHGEDVKELYYYLDNVPTHYYMKYLYKYPQAPFPYLDLIHKNAALSKADPEYEILDTGVFNEGNYFDVFVEYAKNNSEDIFIKIEIVNRSSEAAALTVLPTLWFYNRWQYGGLENKPVMEYVDEKSIHVKHERAGEYFFYFKDADDKLLTENETNFHKLFGLPNKSEFLKDAFHEAIIGNKNLKALQEKKNGTKFSPVYHLAIEGGQSQTIYLRLVDRPIDNPFENAEACFVLRRKEADEFYQSIFPQNISVETANIKRQAFAGLLWNKQYYHYDVQRWLNNSDGITAVSDARKKGRNHDWVLLKNQNIISMPDKWEYPWYAAWDSAFHAISMAVIDPVFAKNQLLLLMREWYMNPEGQLPAYEWNFNDVNPPVHAFAALQVYYTEKEITGKADINFLKKIFQKLIINFTWWTNRKDARDNNIFEGGFLGLDNIGAFNRSGQIPDEVLLEQTDGTSWMGMYALNMLDIALEIAMNDDAYEDAATKFYEHFVIIAAALNELGLWNEENQFFYDVLALQDNTFLPLEVRSIVGLVPLYAVSIIEKEKFGKLTDFKRRMDWLKSYRFSHSQYLPSEQKSDDDRILLSLVHKEKLVLLLRKFLDEKEFLSDGGIRSLSKYYLQNPYSLIIENNNFTIHYDPADSTSSLFGGNSNWRGPVWMPINYLFIKSLEKYGEFYGEEVKAEYPSGSGNFLNLKEIAEKLTGRLIRIFENDENGNRPVFGDYNWFYQKEENKNLLLFHEYFHGDSARGLGASHQTGWTALIADLILTISRLS